MIYNLIPYLKHKYGKEILLYFIEEVKVEAIEDRWNETTNRVVCAIDAFLEEEIEDEISLDNAQSFMDIQKQEMEKK